MRIGECNPKTRTIGPLTVKKQILTAVEHPTHLKNKKNADEHRAGKFHLQIRSAAIRDWNVVAYTVKIF